MSHNVLAVSNELLTQAESQGISVSPMQLQKLLYFLDGWHMELNDGARILSDRFEAWQFGPVCPTAYHEFKHFGSGEINELSLNPFSGTPWPASLSTKQKQLVGEILRIYGSLTGPQMSHLTHKSGTPWDKTWNGGVGKGDTIEPQLVHEEFKGLRNRA